jgi:hypothetical protein
LLALCPHPHADCALIVPALALAVAIDALRDEHGLPRPGAIAALRRLAFGARVIVYAERGRFTAACDWLEQHCGELFTDLAMSPGVPAGVAAWLTTAACLGLDVT